MIAKPTSLKHSTERNIRGLRDIRVQTPIYPNIWEKRRLPLCPYTFSISFTKHLPTQLYTCMMFID